MSTSGIYQICNTVNGHIYIGSAVDIQRRWRQHLSLLRKNKHHSTHLQNAWNKYKETSFVFSVIEECDSLSLLEREQKYIDTQCPEYNTNFTAGNSLGTKHSDEAKRKMSEFRMGRPAWNKGKSGVYSEEAIQKMSLAKKGKPSSKKGKKGNLHDEETKRKIGISNKGKHSWWKGKTLSDETKSKISESLKGKNTWMRGKTLSPETKARIGVASKAMWERRRSNAE